MSRQRVPPGPPAAPPVQRLRLRYVKRGPMRFSSTRDFQRALERALRRAAIPMAFSAGFHPHPRISYANAAPTGAASEAEYVELALAESVDPQQVAQRLNRALPAGLAVVQVAEAGPDALADRLQASRWQLVFRGLTGQAVRQACTQFLASDRCEVTRVVKSGPRTFDTRAAVLRMDVTDEPDQGYVILRMVVRHTTPAVRPDDILTALHLSANLDPPWPPLVTRMAQGPLVSESEVADPLVPDQDVNGL